MPNLNGNPWIKLVRDVTVITIGGGILIHETVFGPADPILVGAGLVLLGVPAALRLDEKR